MKIDFIGVIAPLCILPPIIIAVVKWPLLTARGKWIFWCLVLTAIFNIAATITGKVFHKNNMPFVHVFTALEVIMFIVYYKMLLSKKAKNPFYFYLATAFVAFSIINAVFIQGIYAYSSYTRSVEAIICMLFALNYFAGIATGKTGDKSVSRYDFYFNAGIFLYFSGAFMLFIFSNFVITNLSRSDFNTIWTIHAIILAMMYALFSVGFILCKK